MGPEFSSETKTELGGQTRHTVHYPTQSDLYLIIVADCQGRPLGKTTVIRAALTLKC